MAADARTIVIVGGVAGGASAAARARRCNEHARIILYEKDEHISFANCGLPYYVGGEISGRDELLVASPELLHDRFRIEVRAWHLVTAIDPQARTVSVRDLNGGQQREQAWDRLILAPGAQPIVPPLDGIDAANVFTLRNLSDADRIVADLDRGRPQSATVVGAGFIGLEMIEQLHLRQVGTQLVELQRQVLAPLDAEMAHLVQQEIAGHDVALHLGDGIAGIETDGRRATGVKLASGRLLPTELVILGIGVRPNLELASAGLTIGSRGGIAVNDFLQTSNPFIYAVGDAVEYSHGVLGHPSRIALAGPANRAGRIAGEHAATGAAVPMTPPVGTAIVRVFDLTAGVTGVSEKLARSEGLHCRSVLVSPKHHAGYFPGAETIVVKLTYEVPTGRVLGGQVIGRAGVDKRIDVVATALRFQGSVWDLGGLDLAYAPPYGAAKDPIHMAAFAACNDLQGLTPIADVGSDLADRQVVDVRTDRELAMMRLEGVHHIPLDQLRDRLEELDPDLPTVAVCHTGQRAHVATRLLRQRGFRDVRNLTGGMFMRQHARPHEIVRG